MNVVPAIILACYMTLLQILVLASITEKLEKQKKSLQTEECPRYEDVFLASSHYNLSANTLSCAYREPYESKRTPRK